MEVPSPDPVALASAKAFATDIFSNLDESDGAGSLFLEQEKSRAAKIAGRVKKVRVFIGVIMGLN